MTTSRAATGRRSAGIVLAGILLAALVPAGTAAAPSHSLNVASRNDFVAQTNFVQCVGASMQMMINMIEPGRDRTAATQLRLQRLARLWSGSRPDGRERQGASVRGWSSGLNIEGVGPYKLVGLTSLQEALDTAAKAIAETGKPVGLLVWRGRHAWVMSGFTATADPTETDDYRVTHANIHDPLYPHGSSVWGRSPSPGQSLSVQAVGKQFVQRRNSMRWIGQNSTLGGKWVLVLPYATDPATVGDRII